VSVQTRSAQGTTMGTRLVWQRVALGWPAPGTGWPQYHLSTLLHIAMVDATLVLIPALKQRTPVCSTAEEWGPVPLEGVQRAGGRHQRAERGGPVEGEWLVAGAHPTPGPQASAQTLPPQHCLLCAVPLTR